MVDFLILLLISKGANIEAKNDDGYTPLHFAIKYRHIKIVKYLISQSVNINIKSKD